MTDKSNKFRGPRANGVDIDHIYDNHHPNGKIAMQRGPSNSLFPELWTKEDIEKCVWRAWGRRKKNKTQSKLPGSDQRIRYRGVDPDSGLTLEIWYNRESKIIETAYPLP